MKRLLLRYAALGLSFAALLDLARGLQGRGFVLSAVLIGAARGGLAYAAALVSLSAAVLAVAFARRSARWPLALATIVLGGLGLLSIVQSAAFLARTQTLALQSAWPLPFSLLVTAMLSLFLWLAWRARREPSLSAATRSQHLIAASIVGSVAFTLEVVFIHAFGLTDYRRQADAILVLGARAYADGSPSEALAERVATGIALYQQGYAPKLVMSGGIGEGGVSEPEVMQRLARDAGVPAAAIVLDAQGNNTEASVRNLSQLGLKARPKVLIVSHYHHLPRAKLLSKLHGVRAFTVPADEGETRLLGTPYYVIREAAGLAYYFVRG